MHGEEKGSVSEERERWRDGERERGRTGGVRRGMEKDRENRGELGEG